MVALLSLRIITIAFAVRGRFIAIVFCDLEKSSRLPFHRLVELLRSLSRFTVDSLWPLLHAHGIIAIASAICGIHRDCFLRECGFIAITIARSREGEHGNSCKWSFTSELTSSRKRQNERDFRVVLRVILRVIPRVVLVDLGAEDWRLRQRSQGTSWGISWSAFRRT